MENKEIKNNNGIILGVMAFIIIILAGLCIYLLFIKKDEGVVDNNNNKQNNTQVTDSDDYDAWMNYLLKQNITKITYDQGIKNYETGELYPIKEVSIDALKSFFKDFKSHNYKLVKQNVQGRGDGANYITITYLKNGKEYNFTLDDGYWTEGNSDTEFIKSLESMGYKEEGFDKQFSSLWYIFRDEVEDSNTDINRFDKYYAKYFR